MCSGGGNKEEREWKKQEKEAAYQAQLDVLKRRKSGAWQKVPFPSSPDCNPRLQEPPWHTAPYHHIHCL